MEASRSWINCEDAFRIRGVGAPKDDAVPREPSRWVRVLAEDLGFSSLIGQPKQSVKATVEEFVEETWLPALVGAELKPSTLAHYTTVMRAYVLPRARPHQAERAVRRPATRALRLLTCLRPTEGQREAALPDDGSRLSTSRCVEC